MVEVVPPDVATQLIEVAETRADEIENPMVVTVANSEGNLIVQHRMDGVWPVPVNISRNKAHMSVILDMSTHELVEASEPGNSLYGLDTRDDGWMVVFGGGYPLERDGEVVGIIGIPSGAVTQDRDVAKAGVERWTKLVEADVVPSDDWAVPGKCERLTTDRGSDRTWRPATPAARL